MRPLKKTFRSMLESAIRNARDTAEEAARAALERLGVGEPEPWSYLSEQEKELRRTLRAHGRQLGDVRDEHGYQALDHLIEEVAYEHWHRMLFARFLAENNLLMYPDEKTPVPITLDECQELAASEGAADGWELAARFAARMLPQIFRPDSPVFRLVLPPEYRQKLEQLLTDLPQEVFLASDSLGWVYQFWQAKRKDAINDAEIKIGARELPAVTQLFTEPYMVSFLLDNSLGAWWAGKRLSNDELKNAPSEEVLRQSAAIPGVPLEYLRFVQLENGSWYPAAGVFERWPTQIRDLKILDPCCGSGHFLVGAFLMLVPMRMELEGLSTQEAIDAVLRENLFGLDIDKRVTELAAFALALAAWSYPNAGGYRPLPRLHIACSGLSMSLSREEWRRCGKDNHNLTLALDWMYDTFTKASLLGSLINPAKAEGASLVRWEKLSAALERAVQQEKDEIVHEAAVAAQGLAKAAVLLGGKYHLVTTNVPYLARGKQSEELRDYCGKMYPEAQYDLATVFLERCLEFCAEGSTTSIVLPQNWLFLKSYKDFREKLLRHETWHLIARLGSRAFETITGEVVKAALFSISRGVNVNTLPGLFEETHEGGRISGIDVSEYRDASEKAEHIKTAEIAYLSQKEQLKNPDARIVNIDHNMNDLLSRYSFAYQGIATSDYFQFGRKYWEIEFQHNGNWVFQQTSIKENYFFGGKENALLWENGKGKLTAMKTARIQGLKAWKEKGIAVAQMRKLPVTLHTASSFDNNTAVIIPKNPSYLPAIWCYCSSPEYQKAVRDIDQTLKVTNATLVKVPFDLEFWTKVAREKYPHGLPKPYSDDPTQWIFHGHPCGSVIWDEEKKWIAHGPLRRDATVLQVAVARLLGYRWPAELDPAMELADEQRVWVQRCDSLLPYADGDGIVCIPPVHGEASAAERLLDLLAAAYGPVWSTDTLAALLASVECAGGNLESWLRDRFFLQHCKLFQHRPFIWHIWDGLPDGFAALLNYHKLDRKNLELLIYTYLGDWISRQRQDIAAGIDGAQERLAAAESLKKKLELILEGEAPYDIFVRWKSLDQQPIGWDPDLNDGVRLNIRPFMSVPDVGKKGSGVLRDKPNINWNKDKGKDLESAPWYHVFKGERINDYHLTLEEKRRAREH